MYLKFEIHILVLNLDLFTYLINLLYSISSNKKYLKHNKIK